jgi:uncharacterized protein DUF742
MTRDDSARDVTTANRRHTKKKRTTVVGRTGARFPSAHVLEQTDPATLTADDHPTADTDWPPPAAETHSARPGPQPQGHWPSADRTAPSSQVPAPTPEWAPAAADWIAEQVRTSDPPSAGSATQSAFATPAASASRSASVPHSASVTHPPATTGSASATHLVSGTHPVPETHPASATPSPTGTHAVSTSHRAPAPAPPPSSSTTASGSAFASEVVAASAHASGSSAGVDGSDAGSADDEDVAGPIGARFGPYSGRKARHAKENDTGSTPVIVDESPPTPPGEPTPEQSAERTVQIVMPWAGALVRPYAHTGGRTRSSHDLALEALVSTSGQPSLAALDEVLTTHHRRMIVDMCRQPRSVAEVAALLSVPLGVARVLLGDLAAAGLVVVHPTAGSTGDGAPDLDFMRRVLVGLRGL